MNNIVDTHGGAGHPKGSCDDALQMALDEHAIMRWSAVLSCRSNSGSRASDDHLSAIRALLVHRHDTRIPLTRRRPPPGNADGDQRANGCAKRSLFLD